MTHEAVPCKQKLGGNFLCHIIHMVQDRIIMWHSIRFIKPLKEQLLFVWILSGLWTWDDVAALYFLIGIFIPPGCFFYTCILGVEVFKRDDHWEMI